jgi:hypothetical protein
MATINIALDQRRQKKDGTYPLIIRITQNRESTYIKSGISLRAEDWDETGKAIRKTHPNHKLLNHSLKRKLAKRLKTEITRTNTLGHQ